MKTVNEWIGFRHIGSRKVTKLAESSGVNIRTLYRWINSNGHYIDESGIVYKKVGKIDTSKQRD